MRDYLQIMRWSVILVLILMIGFFALLLRPVSTSAPTTARAPRHSEGIGKKSSLEFARDARQSPTTPASSTAHPAPPPPASVTELLEENRRLRATNELLQERLRAVLNWILANFRGRYPLPESLFARVQIPPLTEDGLLNPEIGDLLRLSPDEMDRLNDALSYAVDYLSQIESAILTTSEPRAGKVILHIPTFRENGQLLKEDLYAAMEATLGSDRFSRFLKVAETGLLQRFYHFGEASRTMVFELTYVENDPTPRLLIKDGYILEIEPGVREITATETVTTNLPAKYFAYLAWLPEYMGGTQTAQ